MADRDFYDLVYRVVSSIPKGRVMTYAAVGRACGKRRAARQVGYALRTCDLCDEKVPWHRVINSRGMASPGDDPDRPARQKRLLEREGVAFDSRGRCDLEVFGWVPPVSTFPEDTTQWEEREEDLPPPPFPFS